MNWYITALKKYTAFSGRARRKEYWMFVLFNVIFSFIAVGLDFLFGQIIGRDGSVGIFSILYSLAIALPSLAVAVRRLHDIGKNGWWFFITFVPLIGSIWYLILLATDSQPGENEYGPNPKEFI